MRRFCGQSLHNDFMESQPLAYLNREFLESEEARPLRILAEYLEPLRRFKAQNIQDTVVFFGSARIHSREHAEKALEGLLRRFGMGVKMTKGRRLGVSEVQMLGPRHKLMLIRRDDVEKAYRRVAQANQTPSPEEAMTVKLGILNEMIVQDILVERARTGKVELTDAELDKAYAERRQKMNDDQFQKELSARGLTAADVRDALRRQSREMLLDVDGFTGISALERFAADLPRWPAEANDEADRAWCFRYAYQVIEVRGTGGGLFRSLYARFLREAEVLVPPLAPLGLAARIADAAVRQERMPVPGIAGTGLDDAGESQFTRRGIKRSLRCKRSDMQLINYLTRHIHSTPL